MHGRRRARRAKIVAFSGPSGVGKTTLLVKLIPALVARGLRVAALKRSGHRHAFDRPGKDSTRLRAAGAVAVALQGPAELAWFGPPSRGGPAALAALLPPVDVIVAEGFKDEHLPRVEVHRAAVSTDFLCARDPCVFAVVSDEAPPRHLPWFGLDDVEALAEHVARFARGLRRPSKRALASTAPRAQRLPGEAERPREKVMARTTNRSRTSRGGGSRRRRTAGGTTRRTTRGRSGGATVREAGRKGGRRTLERRGPEFYSRIGRKGGKASGNARRGAARSRRGTAGASRRTGGRRTTSRRSGR